MDDCIFCQIVKGKIPAQRVYEDDQTLAFMTIKPIRPGHILVIPKLHESEIFSLPNEDYMAIMATAYKLAPALNAAYNPKRIGIMAAGWEVPHVHLHVVPMEENHDLTSKRLLDDTAVELSQDELALEQKRIVAKL